MPRSGGRNGWRSSCRRRPEQGLELGGLERFALVQHLADVLYARSGPAKQAPRLGVDAIEQPGSGLDAQSVRAAPAGAQLSRGLG
jgi:hypothetical protein